MNTLHHVEKRRTISLEDLGLRMRVSLTGRQSPAPHLGAVNDRLEPGAAQPVNGESRGGDIAADTQRRVPGNVRSLHGGAL